jgi:predicted phosphoribosyltransferase
VAVRRAAPKQLVLAVPVAPPSTVERLRPDVDALICLEISEGFFAIAQFYRVFAQVEDGEVIALLDRAARSLAAGEHARQAARHDG